MWGNGVLARAAGPWDCHPQLAWYWARQNYAAILRAQRDVRDIEKYEQDKARCEALGDREGVSRALANLHDPYYRLGDYARARELREQAAAIGRTLRDSNGRKIQTVGALQTPPPSHRVHSQTVSPLLHCSPARRAARPTSAARRKTTGRQMHTVHRLTAPSNRAPPYRTCLVPGLPHLRLTTCGAEFSWTSAVKPPHTPATTKTRGSTGRRTRSAQRPRSARTRVAPAHPCGRRWTTCGARYACGWTTLSI